MKFTSILLCLFLLSSPQNTPSASADAILGNWESVKNNLKVEVYKDHDDYRARIIWFKNISPTAKPIETWQDEKNPDLTLRSRKVLGMDVLRNFVFNTKNNRWENGEIYDCTTGKTWSSSAWLTDKGFLKVRGFWHFEFIGQTMAFKRF